MHRLAPGEGAGGDMGDRPVIGEIIFRGVGPMPMGLPFAEFALVMEIRAVDVQHVSVAVRIIGVKHLMRAQRYPADAGAHMFARFAAEEGDQGRSIDVMLMMLAGNPAPAPIELGPAAVMERRPAPRRIVDPGPAPGADIVPMAMAVR